MIRVNFYYFLHRHIRPRNFWIDEQQSPFNTLLLKQADTTMTIVNDPSSNSKKRCPRKVTFPTSSPVDDNVPKVTGVKRRRYQRRNSKTPSMLTMSNSSLPQQPQHQPQDHPQLDQKPQQHKRPIDADMLIRMQGALLLAEHERRTSDTSHITRANITKTHSMTNKPAPFNHQINHRGSWDLVSLRLGIIKKWWTNIFRILYF